MSKVLRPPALWALTRQLCPRCRRGRIFRGATTMNATCPVCDLVFEREEGYFLGAMYISYPMSVLFLGLGLLFGHLLLPDWNLNYVLALAVLAYLPLVPLVFRYSRTIWIYLDRWLWAGPN